MTSGVPLVPDGTPILAVLADSHAALFGHGCTDVGTAKATYGTGSSVMAPVAELSASDARVPTTLAWVIDKSPTYALEGNILSSGATLAWAADLLTDGSVADLDCPCRDGARQRRRHARPGLRWSWGSALGPQCACAHLRHE